MKICAGCMNEPVVEPEVNCPKCIRLLRTGQRPKPRLIDGLAPEIRLEVGNLRHCMVRLLSENYEAMAQQIGPLVDSAVERFDFAGKVHDAVNLQIGSVIDECVRDAIRRAMTGVKDEITMKVEMDIRSAFNRPKRVQGGQE